MSCERVGTCQRYSQQIISPHSFQLSSSQRGELTWTIKQPFAEVSLHALSIAEADFSLPFLNIVQEGSLEFYPTVLDFVEVAVVERPSEWNWKLIVEGTLTIEFVIRPLARVGWAVGTIEESPLSVNAIIFEAALIVDSILIDQSSKAILQVILDHSLISTLVFIALDDEQTFIFLPWNEFIFAQSILRTNVILTFDLPAR